MKRLTFVLLLVAVICSVGFAESFSSADVKYRTTGGGFWSCGKDYTGGFGEFGFNLLPEEKTFVLRDCISVMGEGGYLGNNSDVGFGGCEIGDKLIIGGRYNCEGFIVRTYGFIGVSVGLFSCSGHSFFSLPLMINISFGGGFEFQYSANNAFVIEFGGLNRLFTGDTSSIGNNVRSYPISSPSLTIGFRSFI